MYPPKTFKIPLFCRLRQQFVKNRSHNNMILLFKFGCKSFSQSLLSVHNFLVSSVLEQFKKLSYDYLIYPFDIDGNDRIFVIRFLNDLLNKP